MVRRFYYGLISLRYSPLLVGLPLVIFALAFMKYNKSGTTYSLPMLIVTVILAVIMAVYYSQKFRIARVLRKVKDIDDYLAGGMIDRSYILEDRMLAGTGLHVEEHKTTGIQKMSAEEKGRRVILHLTSDEGTYDMDARDMEEAQRFAAFIRRKNPAVILDIEPKGTGTLRELGA